MYIDNNLINRMKIKNNANYTVLYYKNRYIHGLEAKNGKEKIWN